MCGFEKRESSMAEKASCARHEAFSSLIPGYGMVWMRETDCLRWSNTMRVSTNPSSDVREPGRDRPVGEASRCPRTRSYPRYPTYPPIKGGRPSCQRRDRFPEEASWTRGRPLRGWSGSWALKTCRESCTIRGWTPAETPALHPPLPSRSAPG